MASAADDAVAALRGLPPSTGKAVASAAKNGAALASTLSKVKPSDSSLAALTRGAADDATDLAPSLERGAQVAKNLNTTTKNTPPTNPEKNLSLTERAQIRWNKITEYAAANPGKTLAGLSLVTLAAVAGAFADGTDGETVTITNIERVDVSRIKVTFDPPPPPKRAFFHPAINDTFDFETTTPTTPDLKDKDGCRVLERLSENQLVIEAGITSVNTTPTPTSWGTMTCHSSFGTQLGTAIGEVINFVADTLGNTGSSAFCSIFPSLCDPTIWWIVGGFCLAMCCFYLLMQLSDKKM